LGGFLKELYGSLLNFKESLGFYGILRNLNPISHGDNADKGAHTQKCDISKYEIIYLI